METENAAMKVVVVAVEEAEEGPHQGQATQIINQRIISFAWDQYIKHNIMR